jgi:hypothetical protein
MQFRINLALSIARLHRIFQDDNALGHEFEVEVKLIIFLALPIRQKTWRISLNL